MNRVRVLVIMLSSFFFQMTKAQTTTPGLFSTTNFTVVNRSIAITKNEGKTVVHMDGREDNGVAWINKINFTTGIIELDVKGKDVVQHSFVGIAFHGINDTSYDAVYFRPFNFNSPDAARAAHAVQYISMPKYDWFYLRENFPGKYENALTSPVDANNWFHVRIVVDTDKIEVFVNDDARPALSIKPLNKYSTGKIGFWVGNTSDGDFSNLTIKNK